MAADEDDFFVDAMRGVKRLKSKPRAGPSTAKSPARQERHPVQQAFTPSHHAGPGSAGGPWVLKSDGISSEQLRRLAAGRPAVDMELDLHGMTKDEALSTTADALAGAMSRGLRVVSLVHGRGLHSQSGRPVLKHAVYDWLRHGPLAGHVLAVVPKPGSGGGSCLILLRRSR